MLAMKGEGLVQIDRRSGWWVTTALEAELVQWSQTPMQSVAS
jgi:hypothetical protein